MCFVLFCFFNAFVVDFVVPSHRTFPRSRLLRARPQCSFLTFINSSRTPAAVVAEWVAIVTVVEIVVAMVVLGMGMVAVMIAKLVVVAAVLVVVLVVLNVVMMVVGMVVLVAVVVAGVTALMVTMAMNMCHPREEVLILQQKQRKQPKRSLFLQERRV